MKKHYIKLITLAVFFCLSSSMFGQTPVIVGDSLRFLTVLDSMKNNGGGTIQLAASVRIPIAKNQTFGLESTSSNPIQINTNQYSLIANGDGTSADSCILRIGNYMTITGTGTVISGIKRGHIRVVGGSVTSNTTTSGTSTIYNNDGWIFIWGGTVSVNAIGLTAGSSAAAVTAANYMSLIIVGGTISATGDYTRAVVGNELGNGIVKPISGATINASGSNAYGIQVLGIGADTPMFIGNNLTINTNSTDATDAGIVNGGSTSVIMIPSSVTGLTLNCTTPMKLDNTAGVLLDLRGVTLTASPVSGTALVNPTDIVFTASGNATMSFPSTKIYYTYSTTAPIATSPTIVNGGKINVASATNTITAMIGLPYATYNTTSYPFNYTVQNAVGPINIPDFATLVSQYNASQAAAAGTTQMKLTASFSTSGAYTITPDATHPVIIDANGFQITTASSGTWGGNLSISSTTTTGILKIAGAYTTNITGGTYTVTGNAPIIYASSGSGVTDASTKLYLSNSTFTVNGTTNGASIIKMATNNGNLISATNCIFNVSTLGSLFTSSGGPQNIILTSSTLNVSGSDANTTAFTWAPASQALNYLTVDGLTINMNSGKIFAFAGSKTVNAIIKSMTVNSTTSPILYSAGTTTGFVLKFYDFRALTTNVAPGTYSTSQNVTLSMGTTAVDAAGAAIYYTTDGTTEPTAASTLYTAPISVSSNTTIKSIAIKDTFTGNSKTFAYIISGTDIANPEKNALSVYPTTVENMLNISASAARVQVYDITGKSVISKNNVKQLDLSAIHSGVYLVKVSLSDATSKTFKVVKQ